jgi:hypothetical protein
MNNQQQMQLNIDLKDTTPLTTPSGKQIFQQGFIIRKASRFMTGTPEDALIPIPVFFDPVSHKILKEALPVDIRELMNEEDLI